MNSINMENKAFIKRIKNCIGGINLMRKIGFVEKRGKLSLPKIDGEVVQSWIDLLADYVENKVIVVE